MPVLTCPACKTRLQLPDGLAGKKAQCGQCQEQFVIPGDTAISAHSGAKFASHRATGSTGSRMKAGSANDAVNEVNFDDVPARQGRRPTRRPRYDFDDDDEFEEERPRHRRRKQSSGSPLLLVLLVVGGLFAAIAFLVVMVIIFWPFGSIQTTGPGPIAQAPNNPGNPVPGIIEPGRIGKGPQFEKPPVLQPPQGGGTILLSKSGICPLRQSVTHNVQLQANVTYEISLTTVSQIYDPYLEVRDTSNRLVTQDDDGAGFPNARLIFRPNQTGTYRLVVRAYENATSGPYNLVVRQL